MEHKKIVLLAGKGESTTIVFNSINQNFGVTAAIIEERESTKLFLKRRVRRLGIVTVFGQILFQILVSYLDKTNQSSSLRPLRNH